ncbi:hypothetical protein [Agrobacterium vitis]|uniref:hypothetical protein n=1 Tax=Agrobacterium vitis TaxID=373 RepID=UPI0012E844A6|nr:hypothetical protein [Agrobacterium vitis]MVA33623.1 hypothetical protein [Agrobacterium vitis]
MTSLHQLLTVNDLIERNGEPTVYDLRWAELLGFDRLRNIRNLIKNHMNELEKFGAVHRSANISISGRGRKTEVMEFWLTMEQALLIASVSNAPRAPEIRHMTISVFVAWHRGRLPVPPANSNTPAPVDEIARKLAVIQEARMTKGPAFAARLWDNLGMPVPPAQLPMPTYDEQAIGCLRHMLRADFQGVKLGQIIRSAFQGERLAVNVLKELRIELKDDGFIVPNIFPPFNALFAGTRWERPFEHLRKLPNAKPHLPWGGRYAKDFTFIPSTYLDEA